MPLANEQSARVAERYSGQARAYEELWSPVLAGLAAPALRELIGARVERVIDIGTGIGALMPSIEKQFPDAAILGVDVAQGMLALVPQHRQVAAMNASELGIASRTFDLAVLAFVLFHIPAPDQALREARRVLRPGGRVATVTWGTELESNATRAWTHELDAHGAPPDPVTEPSSHAMVDSPSKLERLMKSVGFASARSWVQRHERILDAEQLVRLRTNYGTSKRRFDLLDAEAQRALLVSVHARLQALSPADFVARADVAYAIGSVLD